MRPRYNAPSGRERPRLSLTWRAIILNSLLLLGMVLTFTVISHDSLTNQFRESREAIYKARQRELRLALDRSADALTQLAGVAAASNELGRAVASANPEQAARAIAPIWPTLQLDAGSDEIVILDRQGQRLTSQGQPLAGDDPPLANWAETVMAQEAPLTTLRCVRDCRQYVAVPVLLNGASVGIVVVSRSLADITRHAQSMADADIGLLVIDNQGDATLGQAERYLPAWNGALVTLTRQASSLPVVRAASRRFAFHEIQTQPRDFEIAGRTYELAAIAMNDSAWFPTSGHLLLISDVTSQVAAINRDTRSTLLIALAGWLAAEALLLMILWPPMVRLRHLAGLLPRLAQRDFAYVRQAIKPRRARFHDEIDSLEYTILELAQQLGSLEAAVLSRDRELTQRLAELGAERDFINGLLDTARVLILTQDRDGRITLINRYTEIVSGKPEKALIGSRFTTLFAREAGLGERPFDRPSQEEGVMLNAERDQRTIAWYHAPMPGKYRTNAALISVGLDITERKRAEERLAWLAHRDPLTNLYNRRFFQDALERAVKRSRQGAVLFLDLDQFKEVNELSGHNSGDQLLRMVGDALLEKLDRNSVVARLGGDEFSLLIEDADTSQAIAVAERVVEILEGINFSVNGRRHRAIASIGIALYPEHGSSVAELMAGADFAMYKAKESSAQRWHLLSATKHSREELQQRVYWVERIREALNNGTFELYLQPIARLDDLSIQHYEVLLRMHGDDGSLVMPGLFIPIAERSGQIIALDRWVLKQSLALLARLQSRGIKLAVNLSGQSLHDTELSAFLASELHVAGADPQQLILEVTETAAVTDFSTARGVLQAIRQLGCQTALDDFGVGFSSFHYLGQLPADYIKIDGSFIQKLLTSSEDRLVVKAIADIATGFGKETIAEFVDQPSMLPLLQQYGITFAQGYYIGRPVPVAAILARYDLSDDESPDATGR